MCVDALRAYSNFLTHDTCTLRSSESQRFVAFSSSLPKHQLLTTLCQIQWHQASSHFISAKSNTQSRIPWGGHLRCQTGLQYLSARELQRTGRKVGRSPTVSTMASSAMKRENENSSDDSLKAAVKAIEFAGVHHVGMLCESVENSLKFYCGILGLEINPTRPDEKLSFGGVWLNVGSTSQMIHLMELPNPDPTEGRPPQGGRDRHACIAVKDVTKVKEVLDKAGVPYTFSPSGSSAVFTRDPDGNTLEFSDLHD